MEAITASGAKSVSFDEAEAQMEKLSGLFVSSTAIQALTYHRGAKLAHAHDQDATAAMELPTLGQVEEARPENPSAARVAVSQDGTHIRTYDDWREVKISSTSVVEVEPSEEPDEPPHVDQVKHSYRAGIWTSEELRAQHWSDVVARGFDGVVDMAALGDGAEWIWKNYAYCFPQRTEILDWIHATARIWEAGGAVLGEGSEETKAWVGDQLEELAQGEALTVRAAVLGLEPVDEAAQDVVRRVGQYFKDHAHRMRYDVFRQAGFPIGSGIVESAAKTVVESRMKRSGQRWAVSNANALLALRAELLSTAPSRAA